jgi:hypothetical protein
MTKHTIPIFKHVIPIFKHAIPIFKHSIPIFKHSILIFKQAIPIFKQVIPIFKHVIVKCCYLLLHTSGFSQVPLMKVIYLLRPLSPFCHTDHHVCISLLLLLLLCHALSSHLPPNATNTYPITCIALLCGLVSLHFSHAAMLHHLTLHAGPPQLNPTTPTHSLSDIQRGENAC